MEPYFRFRWRRLKRRTSKTVSNLKNDGSHFLRKHIIRRFKKLREVRRFVLGWLAIFVLGFMGLRAQFTALDNFYLELGPKSSGVYTEGMVGDIAVINPIFPENDASRAAAKLIFNGLLEYDKNGKLVPDLAKNWSVSDDGLKYTVDLRQDVLWQDGETFDAEDVDFTFRMIRNPDVRSPLRETWKDVTVTKTGDYQVVFELPNLFAPFQHNLTVGILPSHLLNFYNPAQLRLTTFNQTPVGTGPFKFHNTLGAHAGIELIANIDYFAGPPGLDRFVLRTYKDHESLLNAYNEREIVAAAGLRATEASEFETFNETEIKSALLTNQVFAFFQTEREFLKDINVRQALVQGTSAHAVAMRLNGLYSLADSPLLKNHLGYNAKLSQYEYNQEKAKKLLKDANWQMKDGNLQKDGKNLELNLLTQNTGLYPEIAQTLQESWQKLGIKLNVNIVPGRELEQYYIPSREYDVILISAKLGADPDVFNYWHSSQIKPPGLNISKYKSEEADDALEAGRTRLNDKLRSAKYEAFLRTWRADAPAVALYRNHYFYVMRNRLNGFENTHLINPEDRFYNAEEWTVKTQPVLKRLVE